MLDKNFWDDVYIKGTIPWVDKEKDIALALAIMHDTGLDYKAKILDYGCAYGTIGEFFLDRGMSVDFAEISSIAVDVLKKKFGHTCNIYEVSTPKDICNKYDIIICSCVMHHIEKEYWPEFLLEFKKILTKDGFLWLSGFDKSDELIKKNHGNMNTTKDKCYFIEEIIPTAKELGFDIISNKIRKARINREYRSICLKKHY